MSNITTINASDAPKDSRSVINANFAALENAKTASASKYATTTGSANTYAVTLDPAPSAYQAGMIINIIINAANTGASTVNVNSLGAKSIKKEGSTDVSSGELKQNAAYSLMYDGTNFQLMSGGGGSSDPLEIDLFT